VNRILFRRTAATTMSPACYPFAMMSNPAAELVARGYEARGEKRLTDAKNCFAQAVDRCRKANDRLLLAQALSGLGQIEMDMATPPWLSGTIAMRSTSAAPRAIRFCWPTVSGTSPTFFASKVNWRGRALLRRSS